jgi:hypothetical protein
LLGADPLAETSNTRRVEAVVLNGKLLDSQDLERLRARMEPTRAPATRRRPCRPRTLRPPWPSETRPGCAGSGPKARCGRRRRW